MRVKTRIRASTTRRDTRRHLRSQAYQEKADHPPLAPPYTIHQSILVTVKLKNLTGSKFKYSFIFFSNSFFNKNGEKFFESNIDEHNMWLVLLYFS